MDRVIDLSEYDSEKYPVDGNHHVTLKDERTLSERKRLDSSAARRVSTTQAEIDKGDDGQRYTEIDFDEISAVLFEISVESWSLGPLTRETWGGLGEYLGDWLEDEIVAFYANQAEAQEEKRKERSGKRERSGGASVEMEESPASLHSTG
tara:strand:+ start:1471 stop:1920 length:450 start_codon:yes stop_codon:yes gene_type:complete